MDRVTAEIFERYVCDRNQQAPEWTDTMHWMNVIAMDSGREDKRISISGYNVYCMRWREETAVPLQLEAGKKTGYLRGINSKVTLLFTAPACLSIYSNRILIGLRPAGRRYGVEQRCILIRR